jgi:hypothetical protein
MATRPVRLRELWIAMPILAFIVALVILANRFIPLSHFHGRLVMIVVPFWMLMMLGLFLQWRGERKFAALPETAILG